MKNRQHGVFAIACALLISLAAPAAAQGLDTRGKADGSPPPVSVEGTWVLTIKPPMGAPSFLATASYLRDGVLIVSPDRLPPVPAIGVVTGAGQGTWRATGPRELVSTHIEFRYGPAGEVVGTVKLNSALRLTADGALEGTGQLQLCGPMLDNCQPFGPATSSASVIGARLLAQMPSRP